MTDKIYQLLVVQQNTIIELKRQLAESITGLAMACANDVLSEGIIRRLERELLACRTATAGTDAQPAKLPESNGDGGVYLALEDTGMGPEAFAKDHRKGAVITKMALAYWRWCHLRVIKVSREEFNTLWPDAPMPVLLRGGAKP